VNWDGNLGSGDTTDHDTPNQVGTDTDWDAVDTGWGSTCALKTGGSLWCWGLNDEGELGQGSTGSSQYAPVQVGSGTDWRGVDLTDASACAVRTDATLWCWGRNTSSQLGTGDTTERDAPTRVTLPGGAPVSRLAAATGYTILAIT
jgi:alpha-tubulin suppressor-like RCC1 family protein